MTITLPKHNLAKRVSIVLVEPKQSLNVGAVARAMLNLGFSDLLLIDPQYQEDKAWVTARSAEKVIKSAKTFNTLEEALSAFNIVYGLSARDSMNRHGRMSLVECSAKVQEDSNSKVAIIFGPEATGLRKEHLDLCTHLVRIPSNPEFESFNLAQAATLVMYELTRNLNIAEQVAEEDMASFEEIIQIEKLVDNSASLSGFYGKGTPSHIPSVVHNLIKRTEPTKNEASVLLGLFSKIRKALNGEIPVNK